MVAAFANAQSNFTIVSGTTHTVLCPDNTTTGDLLLFFAANDAANSYTHTATGLTYITDPASSSTDLGSCLWYRIADGTDTPGSTTYTVTKSGSATTQPRILVCLRFTGIDTTAFPLASTKRALNHNTTVTTSSGTATNPTSIASTDLVVRVYMCGMDASGSGFTMSGTPTGFTVRAPDADSQFSSFITNSSGKFNCGMRIMDRTGTAPATTACTSSISGMWDIYTIALPATTGITVSLGLASETCTAYGLTLKKAITLGLASESETARVIVVAKSFPLGLASASASAYGLSVTQVHLAWQALIRAGKAASARANNW